MIVQLVTVVLMMAMHTSQRFVHRLHLYPRNRRVLVTLKRQIG